LTLEGSGSVTLSGSGTVAMTTTGSYFNGSANLINQETISGIGSLGEEGLSIANRGTIVAKGGTLTVQTNNLGITNTALMEASGKSNLWLISPIANAGGTIEALTGGVVTIDGNVSGGTLTTSGTGAIQLTQGSILSGVTNTGLLEVSGNSGLLQNTLTNNATLELQSGTLYMSGNVTLAGSGTTVLAGSSMLEQNVTSNGTPGGSLTNQQLIHGAGQIYNLPLTNQVTVEADNKSAPLIFGGSTTTNTGILEASGGATLEIQSGEVIDNLGGTIEALAGSQVILSGTVSGGTLTTSGNGVIEGENGILDGTVNVPTNAGNLKVEEGLTLQGTINNMGSIALSGNACIALTEPTTLTGGGKITMGANNCIYGSGIPLTNQTTIQGAGNIGGSDPMPITNSGTILANSTSPLTITPNSSGFENNGTLTVASGSTLAINMINGPFLNLSGGTLTGGTYYIIGTLEIGSGITTNATTITLTGASEIYNSSTGTNALVGLTTNAATGVLSLQNGQQLTTTTNLTNAGKITVGTGSGLSVKGLYAQTGGTTTVDGTLSARTGLNLKKGALLGKGTIGGAGISSDATIVVGDSTTTPGILTVSGSYVQNAAGILDVAISGTEAGSQYSQLAVSGGVTLGGTLNIKVAGGFVSAIGDTFTILTGSSITGEFASVTGTTINSGEHFEVGYTSTAVTLTVASGS
jgi:fibronectin-binding autotransporter adhesin